MIKEYDMQIYPRKLWVAVNTSLKEINSKFFQKGDDLSESQFSELIEKNRAVVFPNITTKRNRYFGILVVILKNDIGIKTIAHESYHVTNLIMTNLGEEPKGDLEQNAYLLGWVAEKIHETMQKAK